MTISANGYWQPTSHEEYNPSVAATPSTEIANGQDQTFQAAFTGRYRSLLTAAEALHKSIVKPLLSPTSDHYRALQSTHAALLKTVKDITGKDAPFIQWNTTGPVRPPTAG
ncbi:hypothetical protein [Mesorhizobium waimense]|uniref:hypothetical protein n=1 Tax=Mesorhizobium waimense TaxID=1300307 RepID=UPI00315CC42C